MPDDLDQNELAELGRHSDSMLWTVTSLWAAAVGGLLVYSGQHFDPWLSTFGLGLTVCAMYFAYSFRVFRRRILDAMPEPLRNLVVARPGLRQWDVFTAVFLGLVVLWARVLISNAQRLWPLWLLFALAGVAVVLAMWWRERRPRSPDGHRVDVMTAMEVPIELVPVVRELIAKRRRSA